MESASDKLPLPQWLKIFTSNGVPVPKAMAIAGKVYKECNTRGALAELTDQNLRTMGLSEKDDRKTMLSALRQAGFKQPQSSATRKLKALKSPSETPSAASQRTTPTATSSTDTSVGSPSRRKRKRSNNYENEFLSKDSNADDPDPSHFHIEEDMAEENLATKFVVINRAPIMTAWAMIVAESLGFDRPEALSIASVYTEMNAMSKGISLGVYSQGKDKDMEARRTGSQPYVELMGRSPLYRTSFDQWRALSQGTPVPPSTAWSYVTRSLHQTAPHVLGSLRLLAQSYPPEVLKERAWNLYLEFRPAEEGWGKRSEMHCKTILGLRRKQMPAENALPNAEGSVNSLVTNGEDVVHNGDVADSSSAKRPRLMALEDYEAVLDADTTFDHVDLNIS